MSSGRGTGHGEPPRCAARYPLSAGVDWTICTCISKQTLPPLHCYRPEACLCGNEHNIQLSCGELYYAV